MKTTFTIFAWMAMAVWLPSTTQARPAADAASQGSLDVAGECFTVSSVRSAVMDLQARFGARYPGSTHWLRRLDKLEQQPDREELRALAHEALVANPLVSGQPRRRMINTVVSCASKMQLCGSPTMSTLTMGSSV